MSMLKENIMKNNSVFSRIKNKLRTYIFFLPSFLVGAGSAFFVDFSIYTFLKPILGINSSALISFIFGTLTIYSILRIRNNSKIKSKKIGFSIQFLIGIGSFVINLIILNLLDFFPFNFFQDQFLSEPYNSRYIAAINKLISSSFGFIWTSSMTSKILFSNRKK